MGCFITMGDLETGLGQASGPLSPSEAQSGSDLVTAISQAASDINLNDQASFSNDIASVLSIAGQLAQRASANGQPRSTALLGQIMANAQQAMAIGANPSMGGPQAASGLVSAISQTADQLAATVASEQTSAAPSAPSAPTFVPQVAQPAPQSSSTSSFLNLFSALTTAGAQVGSAALQAQAAARQRASMMPRPGVPVAPVVVAQPAPGMSTGTVLAIAGVGLLAAGGLYYFMSSSGGSKHRAAPAPAPTPAPAPAPAAEPAAAATKANPNKRGRKASKKCKSCKSSSALQGCATCKTKSWCDDCDMCSVCDSYKL